MSELAEREKILLLATEIMGWTAHSCAWGKTYSFPDTYPFLVVFTNGETALWRDIEATAGSWNPIESISDAMEMQAQIPVNLTRRYVNALLLIVNDGDDPEAHETLWRFAAATAAQRCDAAIAALEAQCWK